MTCPKQNNKVGKTFGGITVLKVVGRQDSSPYRTIYDCVCSYCGREFETTSKHFSRNKSCGCLKKNQNLKHGQGGHHRGSKPRLYRIWRGMKTRCLNPNANNFNCYGGKGITICTEWHEFLAFSQWALSNGYTDNLTIDRIDSLKGYEPANCQWVTQSENSIRANKERTGKKYKTT